MPSRVPGLNAGAARDFRTTRWSVVLAARNEGSSARPALAELCAIYWYPLYAFVRRQGHSSHDAQDLTQEFFARLLSRSWLEAVARERGRFRAWLLAAMKHFLAKEWNRAQAIKRGGAVKMVPLDEVMAESLYAEEPAEFATAEKLYDRRWAMTLLDRARMRLREEFARAGKLQQFEVLEGTLTGEATPYAQLAVQLESSEGAIKVAVHRLRARYRAELRAEVAQTVASEEQINVELRELLEAVGGCDVTIPAKPVCKE
jgi:RNA polymerase sigma factor (sigma-70 family)